MGIPPRLSCRMSRSQYLDSVSEARLAKMRADCVRLRGSDAALVGLTVRVTQRKRSRGQLDYTYTYRGNSYRSMRTVRAALAALGPDVPDVGASSGLIILSVSPPRQPSPRPPQVLPSQEGAAQPVVQAQPLGTLPHRAHRPAQCAQCASLERQLHRSDVEVLFFGSFLNKTFTKNTTNTSNQSGSHGAEMCMYM